MSSPSASHKPDVTLCLSLPESHTTNDSLKPHERGVRLIQLLLNCARHASSGNLHHADACLRQISQLASITGDSMQRLAARFASALAVRLVKRWPGLYKALNGTGTAGYDPEHARSIFIRNFPCLRFAYAVINRALIQALSGAHAIHLIDLGCGDPELWVPFIKRIAHGRNEPPHLTITCVGKNEEGEEIPRAKLVKEAEALNVPFRLKYINVSLRDLNSDMLDVQAGEAVAVASILSLHTLLAEDDRIDAQFGPSSKRDEVRECKRMSQFLITIESLKPKAMLLVEQEANHNCIRLVDRVVQGLNYYSAVFDCIDATCGGLPSADRTALEAMFGKEIEDIVAGEGVEREGRHEKLGRWGVRLGRAGFRPMRLWYETMEEARRVVEEYRYRPGGGFKVVGDRGSLMMCWRDRPVYAVSAWGSFPF